jgi:hypothetical protein
VDSGTRNGYEHALHNDLSYELRMILEKLSLDVLIYLYSLEGRVFVCLCDQVLTLLICMVRNTCMLILPKMWITSMHV